MTTLVDDTKNDPAEPTKPEPEVTKPVEEPKPEPDNEPSAVPAVPVKNNTGIILVVIAILIVIAIMVLNYFFNQRAS